MIRALIIDDEASGYEVLEELIAMEHKDIVLLPSVSDPIEAVKVIETQKPELVFLDIKLGNSNGFELLKSVKNAHFQVIFVTAYSDYAIQAIKAAALDYLLKPVARKELSEAIDKFRNRGVQRVDMNALRDLTRAPQGKRIALPSNEGIELLPIKDILYVSADRNYTKFHFKDKKNRLIARTLGHFEDQLLANGFVRIHRSHMVNPDEVNLYAPGNGGFVKMSDGYRLEVSRRRKKELLDSLNLNYKD